MMNRVAGALAAAVVVLCSSEVEAAVCSITNLSGVAFGAYDVFSTSPLDSAGSLTYQCTGVGENDLIYIQLSRGGSSTYFPRKLANGAWSLEYNLYLDAARTQVWGDGTSGTSRYGPIRPAEGSRTSAGVFGRAEAGQNVAVGVYADSLVVTVMY